MMLRAVIALVVCSLAGSAFAQAPKDAPRPAVPSTPERTSASFGDWVMRCETTGTPAKRVCEAAQTMTIQGQAAPIAQIAVGRVARTDPMRLTIVLPPNVAIGTKPKVLADKDDKSPVDLSWERCLPGGCVASVVVTDSIVTRFATMSEPGSIVFKDAADRDVALPLSFRGLSQAVAALGKES